MTDNLVRGHALHFFAQTIAENKPKDSQKTWDETEDTPSKKLPPHTAYAP